MEEPLVSVIIPVYNVKDFIMESVHSITEQEYRNLEIILIDDGSTDGSGDMCDQLAQEDSRIRVIHQVNQGLSAARNAGLDIMTGEIISYIDSDDAFHPSTIRKLVEAMLENDADIAVCRSVECHTRGKMSLPGAENGDNHASVSDGAVGNRYAVSEPGHTRPVIYEREDALRHFVEGDLGWAVWNKIYRRKFFETVRFPVGLCYEDIQTLPKIFDRVSRVVDLQEDLIMYRKWGGSISSSFQVNKVKDRERAYTIVYEYIKANMPEIFTEVQQQKLCKKVLGIVYTIFIRTNSKEDKKIYREKIAKLEQEADLKNFDFKLKTKYRLYHSSHLLMKIIDTVYVRTVTLKRAIKEKLRAFSISRSRRR